MAVSLTAHIHCKDNAREAAEFYQSIFGGELSMDTFGEFASDQMPVDEADRGKVMHAYLRGDNGIELMMADTPSGFSYDDGSKISLTLSGEDEDVLRGYWDGLSQGGQVTVPLDQSPWGDVFGMLTDKFGVNWMVNLGAAK